MKIKTREIAIFGMLGALMYVSKIIMEWIPNVHLLGMFTMAYTLVYRRKALYPIYTYVILLGALNGFNTWWIPQLYLWTLLWAVTMLLPKNVNRKIQPFIYMIVCAAHGFLYGTLFAPVQAIFYGLSFEATLTWIASGLPFDFIHGVGNFIAGALIIPVVRLLKYLEGNSGRI